MDPQITPILIETLLETVSGAPNSPAGWAITAILVLTAIQKAIKVGNQLAETRWMRARWLRTLISGTVRAHGRFRARQQARYGKVHLLQFAILSLIALALFAVGALLTAFGLVVDWTMIRVIEPSAITPPMYLLVVIATVGVFLGLDTIADGMRMFTLAAAEARQAGATARRTWARARTWMRRVNARP